MNENIYLKNERYNKNNNNMNEIKQKNKYE